MTPNATFGIYRSRNRGGSWELLTNGLPQSGAYVNVMRMGMTVDTLDRAGIYVGLGLKAAGSGLSADGSGSRNAPTCLRNSS